MVTIILEPHATTEDDEARLSSGWNDLPLLNLGISHAKELGLRRNIDDFDAIFVSDLERAYQTARLAFSTIEPRKLRIDWCLRGWDYGGLTQQPREKVDALKPQMVSLTFPNG